MRTAAAYITKLAERGRYHFTTEDAVAALGASLPAARAALRRLKAKGEVADPFRGFHVIVPPEYRRLGCLPPEQFISQLMTHLGEPYYVALLSAAELHGAAHHRPQAFQVMVPATRRPIECGQVRVQFVGRGDLHQTRVVEKRTPRGPIRVASPEATALELVGYAEQCGGLNNVAAVVDELSEVLEAERLGAAARLCPIAWAQRLGYLLDLSGHGTLGNALAPVVEDLAHEYQPLVRSRSKAGARRVGRWRLSVNSAVELEP